MRYIFIVLTVLVPFFGRCQNLSISELYIDGTTEWIEVHNSSDVAYSGSLLFSGAKSSAFSVDAVVPAQGYALFGDRDFMVSNDDICVVYSGLGLQFKDTSPVDLTLFIGSGLVDTRVVSEALVTTFDNTKASIIAQGTGFIISSQEFEQGYYGTPCAGNIIGVPQQSDQEETVGTQDEQETTETETESGQDQNSSDPVSSIGSQPSLQFGDISIDAVYPFDTEYFSEYITLSATVAFSGSIIIEGLGHGTASKEVPLTIQPGESIIVTDDQFYTDHNSNVVLISSISLTDGGERLRIVDQTGLLLDEVTYTSDTVSMPNIAPKKLPSRATCASTYTGSTIYIDQSFCEIPGLTHNWLDIDGMVVSNKCFYGLESGSIFYQQYLGSYALCEKEIILYESEHHMDLGTGTRASDAYLLTGLTISEIYPQKDRWPEYLELTCQGTCIGTATVHGLGYGDASKTFTLSLENNEYIVLTSYPELFPTDITTLPINALSLNDSGELLELVRQDGHVLDTVVYSGSLLGKSFYTGLTVGPPTPGISRDLCPSIIGHADEDTKPQKSCGILLQHKSPIHFPNKINFAATIDDAIVYNSNKSLSCKWTIDGSIETGTLEGCNPSYIGVSTGGVIGVGLEIYRDDTFLCGVSSAVNLPSKPNKTPNKSVYYQSLYSKWKDRYTTLKKSITKEGYTVTGSGSLRSKADEKTEVSFTSANVKPVSMLSGHLEVISVLPNPPGPDTQESITIRNNTSNVVSVPLFLKRNTRKKLGTHEILPKQAVTLTGSFGLVNKPACFTLESETITYDHFCYGQVEEGISITTWIGSDHEEIPGLGLYSIAIDDVNACVVYAKQPVQCKPLPITKPDLKELKKLAKKATSLTKKVAKYQKKNKKLSQTLSSLKSQFTTFKDQTKKQSRLHKELIYLWRDRLKDDFPEIYTSNGLVDMYSSYRLLLSSSNYTAAVGPISLTSINEMFQLTQGTLPFESVDVQVLARQLHKDTTDAIKKFILPLVQ